MSVNIIKSLDGEEYVLLPLRVYRALRKYIEKKLAEKDDADYVPFELLRTSPTPSGTWFV